MADMSGEKNDKDAKRIMRDFIRELHKGKTMKLVIDGGGLVSSTMSVPKDLSCLSLQAEHKTHNIPMGEIQQILAGTNISHHLGTSSPIEEEESKSNQKSPIEDLAVTIVFGPSVEDQHICCFMESSIEARDRFVNSLKVLKLS